MPRIQYNNTIIYHLHCNVPNVQKDIFGYTGNLKCFKYNLKRDCLRNKNNPICNAISSNGGLDCWTINVIETYSECTSKSQAEQRVNEIQNRYINETTSKLQEKTVDLQEKTAKLPKTTTKLQEKTVIGSDQTILSSEKKEENNKMCQYCSKIFTRRNNMILHQQNTCKKKPIGLMEQLHHQIEEQKTIIAKLEQELTDGRNTNNTINSNNTNTQNIQNNNIIFELGNENFSDFLTQKQKRLILGEKYTSLDFFIKNFHCNEKYPQFQSIKIPSLTKSHCDVFSEENNKYVAKNMNDTVEQLVDYRVGDIQSFLDETPNLPEKTEKAVRDMVGKIENDAKYKREKCAKIKLDMYNKFRKTAQDV